MFRRLTQFYRNVITSMTAFVIWLNAQHEFEPKFVPRAKLCCPPPFQ